VEVRDESFPNSRIIDFVQFIGADIPAIPIADDRNIFRKRRVKAKPNAMKRDCLLAFFRDRKGAFAKVRSEIIESVGGLPHQIVV